MSFLIDPPWLYASGKAYRKLSGGSVAPSRDAVVGAATMGVFLGVSISLYQDRGWTRPIWRACGAESGRDWMLNSGVFRLDWRKAGPLTHGFSAAIFATYPVWLWLGMRRR
jgi:hypothetical protein